MRKLWFSIPFVAVVLVCLTACSDGINESPNSMGDSGNEDGVLKDSRDGQTYRTVVIGSQIWMAENLNYKTENSYCYGDKASNCTKYGRLYTWAAARMACPEGWHLPTEEEWYTLFTVIGGYVTAGEVLKSTSGWSYSGNGTDSYSFSALPAGYRDRDGGYDNEGDDANFWSSTGHNSDAAYKINMDYVNGDVVSVFDYKYNGFSVRCLKDDSAIHNPDAQVEPCKTETVDNCKYGTLTDSRNGQSYKTVTIGTQTWMAQNLNYETSNSYCYGDKASNCTKYGRLYTWAAARMACPEGWHLPTEEEWYTLFTVIGGDGTAGKVLKATSGWNNFGSGTDAYAFSALPAGYRDYNGYYDDEGLNVYFWSSTEDVSAGVLFYNRDDARLADFNGYLAISVRCLKDDSSASVTPRSTIIDSRDGQTYRIVEIGSQTWMAANLNYKTENSYCYEDDESMCLEYGRYYTWAAAMDSAGRWSTNGKGCGFYKTCEPTYPVRGVCPEGWHLPTKAEFETLFTEVDRKFGYGSDAYAFSALLAGLRESGYGERGYSAYIWSSTESERVRAYYMHLNGDYYADMGSGNGNKNYGFSVRCLKD